MVHCWYTIEIFNFIEIEFTYFFNAKIITRFIYFDSSILNATHLIGGEITYTCLGDNIYEIKVVIYEGGPTNSNNTGFDNGGVISIYDMNNNLYDVIEHGVAVSELVVDEFTSECVIPPELCVEKGTYTIFTTSW